MNSKLNLNILCIGFLFTFFICLNYSFFIFGKIPFPGDLLVSSYLPWMEDYKLPTKNPLISDVFSQLFIWKYQSIDSFKSMNWPLWNPYILLGTPLLANYQSSVLYPLNILLFLPRYIGWSLFIIIQPILAAIFMYLTLNLWTNSKPSSIIGSIIFSLGGLMTTWFEFGTAVHAIAWFPLTIFLIEKYLRTQKKLYLYFVPLTLTLTTLAGNLQITIFSFTLSSIYLIFSTIYLHKKKLSKTTLLNLLFIFLSLPLSAIQLLPSAALMLKSIRPFEGYIGQGNFGLLPTSELIKFFAADFYGNPVTGNYKGFLNYFETSSFVGTLSLPLFIYSFFLTRKNPLLMFLLILFGFTLVLGFNNPISNLIYQLNIPLLTSSFASRILFISNFALASIVSISISQLINRVRFNILLSTFVISLVIVAFTFLYGITRQTPNPFTISFSTLTSITAIRNLTLPILILILGIVIVLLLKIKHFTHFSKLILIFFIIGTYSFDLGRYYLKFNPFVDSKLVFPQNPIIQQAQNLDPTARIGRESSEILPPNTWSFYSLQSFEGYDPLYLANYAKYINVLNNNLDHEYSFSRYGLLHTSFSSPYLDIIGVKYFFAILRDKDGKLPGDQLNYRFKEANYPVIFKHKSSAILENPNAFNRAYLANNLVSTPKDTSFQYIKNNPSFNPKLDTLIEYNYNFQPTGNGEIRITDYSPNKVVLKTKTISREVLVLSDQFDPDWIAKINSQQVPIHKTNLVARSIEIPPGENTIEFIYFPKSFFLGLGVTSITLILLTFLILKTFLPIRLQHNKH